MSEDPLNKPPVTPEYVVKAAALILAGLLLAFAIHLAVVFGVAWVVRFFGRMPWLIGLLSVVIEAVLLVWVLRTRLRERALAVWFWATFTIVLGILSLLSGMCFASINGSW